MKKLTDRLERSLAKATAKTCNSTGEKVGGEEDLFRGVSEQNSGAKDRRRNVKVR